MGFSVEPSTRLKKIFFAILILVMLFIAAIPFIPHQLISGTYRGYPLSSVVIFSLFFFYDGQDAIGLILVIIYILVEIILFLSIFLGTFVNQRWLKPYNIILVIDMFINLLSGEFLGFLMGLIIVIAGNVLVRLKSDDDTI